MSTDPLFCLELVDIAISKSIYRRGFLKKAQTQGERQKIEGQRNLRASLRRRRKFLRKKTLYRKVYSSAL